jgi:tetratricopeptide (TPR) repeat protein
MSDGAFSDRVTQLRNRWEADPSSRVFLQLAEEYRHQGRVKEALSVLDRGLKEHPGYLSALVAKGRCHLELGEPEPARTVLERVVKQDATQMVANKLLVRAYLDTGEPDLARERLDLYSLLNDSDPEIEELRRRLHAMEQPPRSEKPGSFPRSDDPFPAAAGGDVFDLGLPVPRRAEADVFELDLPMPRARMAVPADDPFTDLLAVAPAAVAAPPDTALEEEPEPEGSLFPGLASRESRRRYLSGLAAEGLFGLDLGVEEPAVEEPVAAAPVLPPAPVFEATPLPAWPPEPAVEEQSWALEAPAQTWEQPLQDEAPPVFELEERTPWAAEPAALTEPAAEPAATATLGELYLKQGHLAEAERIFHEVLRREPDSPAAQEGLEHLAARREERRPLVARDLLAGYEPGPEGGAAEMRARKTWVLNGYLRRLRGGQRDVS